MEFYDTFNENGVFVSSQDEHDVHYKGLWHKVIRIWLFDKEGNLYLRMRKDDGMLDCINEVHMLSSESVSSCFDRGMFEKLGIHFPATSEFEQACMRKVSVRKVFSDNSEIVDNYFLCDYVGEFDNNTNFFIFSEDTQGLVKVNAKGILNLLSTRTGEVIGHIIKPGGEESSTKFIKVEDIFVEHNEDSFMKFSYVVNTISESASKHKKENRENEMIKKLLDKEDASDDFVTHAYENEGDNIY